MVDENEDDDDDEANDNVAERTLKSRTSSCSCSPSRNSNFDRTIMQVRKKLFVTCLIGTLKQAAFLILIY